MQKAPIGIFDSGYGGLTVLKEIRKKLPQYDYLYLGDNLRAPYGPLSYETVYHYTLECVTWLFAQGCPLVILACNTASAKALRTIQQNDLQKMAPGKKVLGVIRPTAEVIGHYTRTGHVGIMGTAGTVQSGSYLLEIKNFFPELKAVQQACPEWVELVESGSYNSPSADAPVKKHIDELLAKDENADVILLACTHYPLLMNKIRQFVPANVQITDQGKIVADSLSDYLQRHPEIDENCSKSAHLSFFTTGDDRDFNNHASVFFGEPVTVSSVKLK